MYAKYHQLRLWLLILALILGTTSCGSVEQWGEKPSEDWSRGVPLGESVTGSIGLSLEGMGERVYAVWPFEDEGTSFIRFTSLNERGEQVVVTDLEIPGQSKFPRLVRALPGNQHLLWASRQSGDSIWRLYYSLIDERGDFLIDPKVISLSDSNVGKYVVASDQEGGVVVIWDRGDPGDLQYLHVGPDGEIITGPLALGVNGESPSIVVDETRILHLIWLDERDVYYDQLNIDQPTRIHGTQVVDLNATGTYGLSGDSLGGPVLGYADGWVYILWSVLSYFDVESGTASTEYVSFPADAPQEVMGTRIWTLMVEDQPYRDYSGSLNLSGLGPVLKLADAVDKYGVVYVHDSEFFDDWNDVAGAVSDYLMNPTSMNGLNDELVVALTSSQQYRNKVNMQISVEIFKDGQFQGYSVATRTRNISDEAALSIDQAGNVHLFWREGPGGKYLYYATTAPEAKAAIDQLRINDLYQFVLMAGMESLVSIAFLPIVGFFWMLPGLLLLGGWKVYKGQMDITEPSGWLPLSLSIVLYYIVKFTTLPTSLHYVPFSAWINIPADLQPVLRFGVPLIMICIAFLIANKLCKRYNNSLPIFYVSIVLVDALLTLVIYGVNFLGAH